MEERWTNTEFGGAWKLDTIPLVITPLLLGFVEVAKILLVYLTYYVLGVKPLQMDLPTSNKTITLPNLDEDIQGGEQMNLPFSWARLADNLLQRNAYLALAGAFVLLRLLYFMLPKLSSYLKTAGGWRITMRLPILMSLCEYSQSFLEQVRMCLDRQKQPGKRMILQEGAMNAKAWVSKSLVTVSVGEPSSGRVSSPLQ